MRPLIARRLIAGAALVIATAAAAEGAAVAYRAIDLGENVTGRALNDAGQVVGTALVTPPGGGTAVSVPFVYSNGAITYLDLPAGAVSGSASGINSAGEVAGTYTYPGDLRRAFRYSNGVVTEVPAPEGYRGNTAVGINDAGTIAGTAILPPVGGTTAPYVSSNGVSTRLTLPPEAVGGSSIAINNAGQVLTSYSVLQNTQTVARYVLRTGEEGDQVVAPPGYARVVARAINAAGDVLGSAYRPPNQFGIERQRPFIVHDGTLGLLTLPFGADVDGDWEFRGMNDRGDLVGFAGTGFINPIAFVNGTWVEDLGSLTTLPPGYTLRNGIDVNNNGQMLAAAQGPGFVDRTFLLTPLPEPGTVTTFLAVCGTAMLGRRRG